MSAHAPGPWRVHPPGLARALSLRIFAGTKFLASVGNSDDTLAETQANADLIAAAPELLAALKLEAKGRPQWHSTCKLIAKAEGRE